MPRGEPVAEEGQELCDLPRKLRAWVGAHPAPEHVRGELVCSRCPAERQVNAARVHGEQRPERLGDLKRSMVGQHDAGGAHPDPGGLRANVRRQQLGRTARQAMHVVVLGHPVTPVSRRLDGLRDGDGAGEGARSALPVLDPDEVQHGQRK
jgi:hypothetical protein